MLCLCACITLIHACYRPSAYCSRHIPYLLLILDFICITGPSIPDSMAHTSPSVTILVLLCLCACITLILTYCRSSTYHLRHIPYLLPILNFMCTTSPSISDSTACMPPSVTISVFS